MVSSVNVYDRDLERVAVIATWVSLIWKEGYNALGSFQLELQLNDESMAAVSTEYYYGIAGSDTLMVAYSIQVKDGTIVANGAPATWILSQRVSTEVVSNEDAEAAMRRLVSEMSPWPLLELGEPAGLGIKYAPQTSDGTIEDYCEAIAAQCDVGFKIRHDRKARRLYFDVYQPAEDANDKYSTLYGNVGDVDYSASDVKYSNVAVVAGGGEGDERVTVVVGDTDAEGADRREAYIDARNEQQEEGETDEEYLERLAAYGEGKLADMARVESVTFAVDDDVSLGQMLFVNLPEIGMRLKARVAAIQITSKKNSQETEITVGTPIRL